MNQEKLEKFKELNKDENVTFDEIFTEMNDEENEFDETELSNLQGDLLISEFGENMVCSDLNSKNDYLPKKIIDFDEMKVTRGYVGCFQNFIFTDDGKLHVFGDYTQGKLGVKLDISFGYPDYTIAINKNFLDDEVEKIFIGGLHSMVLMSNFDHIDI